MKRISILITCFNKEKYIRDSINSAMRQNAHEIIVVNDSSTDTSKKIISEFSDHIKIINNDRNLGVSASTRIGIDYAQSSGAEFVTLLDGDDVLAPNALDYYRKIIQEHEVDAVYSKVSRDKDEDLRWQRTSCDLNAMVKIPNSPVDYYLQKMPDTTAVCARPQIMTKDYTDAARAQDYQIAFSIFINASKVAISDAITHYCSPVINGENLSSDGIATASSGVIMYMNTYHRVKDHNRYGRYLDRSLRRALRLRHYKIFSTQFSIYLHAITPFKKILPNRIKHKIIKDIYYRIRP